MTDPAGERMGRELETALKAAPESVRADLVHVARQPETTATYLTMRVIDIIDRYGESRIERPENCWWSKIDRLIRITAGSPPCMRARTTKGAA